MGGVLPTRNSGREIGWYWPFPVYWESPYWDVLGRHTTVIHFYWPRLKVNNDDVYSWASQYSDESIEHETFCSSKAHCLLAGIRKVKCKSHEGALRTDVLYDCDMITMGGDVYEVLISVERLQPRCLKCGKVGGIRKLCKAKKCSSC